MQKFIENICGKWKCTLICALKTNLFDGFRSLCLWPTWRGCRRFTSSMILKTQRSASGNHGAHRTTVVKLRSHVSVDHIKFVFYAGGCACVSGDGGRNQLLLRWRWPLIRAGWNSLARSLRELNCYENSRFHKRQLCDILIALRNQTSACLRLCRLLFFPQPVWCFLDLQEIFKINFSLLDLIFLSLSL